MCSYDNLTTIVGQSTVTGDLLTTSQSIANVAKQSLSRSEKISEEEAEGKFNIGAVVPDPVFFCSIEAPSLVSGSTLSDIYHLITIIVNTIIDIIVMSVGSNFSPSVQLVEAWYRCFV